MFLNMLTVVYVLHSLRLLQFVCIVAFDSDVWLYSCRAHIQVIAGVMNWTILPITVEKGFHLTVSARDDDMLQPDFPSPPV